MVDTEENKRGKEGDPTTHTSKREAEHHRRVGAAGPLTARTTPWSTAAQSALPSLTLPPPGFQDAVLDSPTLQTWVLSLSPSWGSVLITLLLLLTKAPSLQWG